MTMPLIAPMPFAEFAPQAYYEYVQSMFELRVKGRAKPAPPVAGLSVSRLKSGKLSVRRGKDRTFEYVTWKEIELLAKAGSLSQAELWNAFKAKEYIITKTRMDAERIYAEINEIPWGNEMAATTKIKKPTKKIKTTTTPKVGTTWSGSKKGC